MGMTGPRGRSYSSDGEVIGPWRGRTIEEMELEKRGYSESEEGIKERLTAMLETKDRRSEAHQRLVAVLERGIDGATEVNDFADLI